MNIFRVGGRGSSCSCDMGKKKSTPRLKPNLGVLQKSPGQVIKTVVRVLVVNIS